MLLDNLANKVNVLCQKIKNLAEKNSHAFLAIDDQDQNQDPIPANTFLPLTLQSPILAQAKNFELVTVTFDSGGIVVNNWNVLKYVGKKRAKFFFITAGTLEYNPEEAGAPVVVDAFLAIGKNGAAPEIVEPRLIKEYARLTEQTSSTETANGIFYLDPNDTVGGIFITDINVRENGLRVLNFMQSLTQIA